MEKIDIEEEARVEVARKVGILDRVRKKSVS